MEKGKKWSEIARALEGRNENAVKNRFNSLLKREKFLKDEVISELSYWSEDKTQKDTNSVILQKIIEKKEMEMS